MAFLTAYPAALSGGLMSASVAFGTACGGQTSNAAPRVDGGIDASTGATDAAQPPDAAIDAREMTP